LAKERGELGKSKKSKSRTKAGKQKKKTTALASRQLVCNMSKRIASIARKLRTQTVTLENFEGCFMRSFTRHW
jgi:hypothetical protein